MSNSYCVILTTAGTQEEAERIAELLVSRRAAACVQVMSIASTYRWKGTVAREPEFLLLIKTASRMFEAVKEALLEIHSYEVPEVVQLPITQGLDRYLEWIGENIGE